MSNQAVFEQRRFPRVPLQYPVKLTTDQIGLRYLAGRTCNLSAGGAYVELADPTSPLPVGTPISLALPRHPGDVLLTADQNLRGTIVRSEKNARGLGICFDRPVTLAIPAA